MKRILIFFGVILVIGAGLVVFGVSRRRQETDKPAGAKEIKIVAGFYPLAEFASRVGGEKVVVETVVPAGLEAHDYEPTPRDIALIQSADLFIYQGAGFDPWAEKAADELERDGIKTLRATDFIRLREREEEVEKSADPHSWLDPVLAVTEVNLIAEILADIDPVNALYYLANAVAYAKTLRDLDGEISAGLKNCESRDIIVSHEAFGYFADRYGLKMTAIAGVSPEEEPSAQRLAEVARLAKEKKAKFIFFETLVSPKLAETIAREAGVGTKVLNPLEGLTEEEQARGKNYVSVTRENLLNLQEALLCR